MSKLKQSKILKLALIASIVIVANLFINYTLSLVWEEPRYDDYCDPIRYSGEIDNKEKCESLDGLWRQNVKPAPVMEGERQNGYCDVSHYCRQVHDEARDAYERNIFTVLVAVGVVVFVLSLLLRNNYVVSVSLSLVAVLDFIIASVRYWSSAESITRVIILAVALAVLFYLAYKKFDE